MPKLFDFPYETIVAWWSGVRAWTLSRDDVSGDSKFRSAVAAFYLSIAIVAAIYYVVLRASGWTVSAGDWLLLQVAPAANFVSLGVVLAVLFRATTGPCPAKHLAAPILLVFCGLMFITTIASVEQFSMAVKMFADRRDPSVSYVAAAVPQLWATSATNELKVRLVIEVAVYVVATLLYLFIWLPRIIARVVQPVTYVMWRLMFCVLISVVIQLALFEKITNQINWTIIAAVAGLK